MAFFGTQDFNRIENARRQYEIIRSDEIELVARQLRAEAFAAFIVSLHNGVKKLLAPAPAAPATGYVLSKREKTLMAQAEVIAEAFVAVGKVFQRLYAPIKRWATERSTRDELMALDDRTLADIGLTRGDIPQVASGLWVPENRLSQIRNAAPKPASNINIRKPQIAA